MKSDLCMEMTKTEYGMKRCMHKVDDGEDCRNSYNHIKATDVPTDINKSENTKC